ncbi:YqaE/Pmp3 family membrane protein [Planococcus faecalis]|uniref:Proteolipid membrane potential modulator n=1 Tax=Planococcus faecalis TaxID=1598147 RepID=A0ABM6IVN2_9BACL|nr:YqaE/Pmp3 family membrane protein [Planococcus faecalis]AQU79767.1 proteolipid membrane potential modulator [Planococcus faecalis]
MYFLAVFLPPLAVLLAGKPFQALMNLLLCLLGFLPGVIHAILVVKDKKDEERMIRQAQLISGSRDN